jgi:transporter family-2 protein
MSPSVLLSLAVVIAAGVAVAAQGLVNAALGRQIGSTVGAAAVSFGVGFVALGLLALAMGDGPALRRLPSTPWALLTGGVLGAFFVWSLVWGVPRLGLVTAFAALILGQMVAALLLDALGAFGQTAYAITWQRMLAVALVAGGTLLSRL